MDSFRDNFCGDLNNSLSEIVEGFYCHSSKSEVLKCIPSKLENIIFHVADKFHVRVLVPINQSSVSLNSTRRFNSSKCYLCLLNYLRSPAKDGNVNGFCALRLADLSMEEAIKRYRGQLFPLYQLTYEYLSSMGAHSYKNAMVILMTDNSRAINLAALITYKTSYILHKKVAYLLNENDLIDDHQRDLLQFAKKVAAPPSLSRCLSQSPL